MRGTSLRRLVLALAVVWPTAAHPWTLDALLRLPLEQLLRLQITRPSGLWTPPPGVAGQPLERRP